MRFEKRMPIACDPCLASAPRGAWARRLYARRKTQDERPLAEIKQAIAPPAAAGQARSPPSAGHPGLTSDNEGQR
jgi:hypothetical protein